MASLHGPSQFSGTNSASARFSAGKERARMQNQRDKRPLPKQKPTKDDPADPDHCSPEPDHVDPAPRDVREAPAPNPNGDKKS